MFKKGMSRVQRQLLALDITLPMYQYFSQIEQGLVTICEIFFLGYTKHSE